MYRWLSIVFVLMLGLRTAAYADDVPHREHHPLDSRRDSLLRLAAATDTLETRVTERNRRLYDSIATKSKRRAVPRLIYKLLFVEPHLDTLNGRIVDESRELEPYRGKTIGRITIDRCDVFPATDSAWLARMSNKLHILTRERIIRRDLLFKPGDKFDPGTIVRSQQLLRSRSYIYDTSVEITPDPADTNRVDLCVITRDSWTIGINVGLHSESRASVSIADENILGTGNTFSLRTNFSRKDFSYGGNSAVYEMPNVFGSFFKARMEVGRNFYEEDLNMHLSKEFLKPADYEVGIHYRDRRSKVYFNDLETDLLVKARSLDLWAGQSHFLSSINSSFFYTTRYNYTRFSERPPVFYGYNPALHDHDLILTGFGLYRERFLSTNMIYGFGNKEYMATGYKAELDVGYSWGEFTDALYLGLSYRTGGFRPMGYLMAGITLGSYIDHISGKWRRSAIDVDLAWFSHLFYFRRNRVRQFLSLHYTQGWNREKGHREQINFTRYNGLLAMKEPLLGTTRMVVNTETVVFTSFQPLGFRFAFFGFADFGLIGYSPNVFKNGFYNTLGFGLRIKNERLVFSQMEIRLGIAFGKGGWLSADHFSFSTGQRLEQFRYRPQQPEIVNFE